MSRKSISIVSGCFNEKDNIRELYERIKSVMTNFPEYDWNLTLGDNCSTDGTREIIRELAAKDKRVRAIFNSNNFGHIRSPMNVFIQADADAVITLCSDLQDPPELIADMIRQWEQGNKVVIAVRQKTECGFLMEFFRRCYYSLLKKMAPEEKLISGFTGFGLYDRCFMDALKKYKDPYPYFRGIVSEIGFKRAELPFVQPKRKHGETKNNFFTLYDMAMTGFVNHTKLPLRLAVFSGFFIAFLSLLTALGYFIYKLCNWNSFQVGMAPLVIGLFFFSAIQLIFIGVLGEYIGAIYTQVKNKPLVIEEERINFDE
ncbi:MAG: glycosyltransferase family 2 protein [Lentisphaerae bacterium]|nr:glycosyltransferase family 2 protein [Lentisphaerota bacterium]